MVTSEPGGSSDNQSMYSNNMQITGWSPKNEAGGVTTSGAEGGGGGGADEEEEQDTEEEGGGARGVER